MEDYRFKLKRPTAMLWSDEIKVYRKSLGMDRDIIIQRTGYQALSDFKPKHNKQGQRICLNCNQVITDRRKKKYCSEACSSQFFAKHNSAAMRTYIFKRDNFTCQKCKTPVVRMGRLDDPYSSYNFIVDHKVPIALGGAEFDETNLWLLCGVCNKEKTKADIAKIAKKRGEIRLVKNPFLVEIKYMFESYPQFDSLDKFFSTNKNEEMQP
jgi:5-methylcytosine-specific restriction endonuclease McrA